MKNTKLSIEEYAKQKKTANKKLFKVSFYPLPVLISLLIPLIILAIAFLLYVFHIKGIVQ